MDRGTLVRMSADLRQRFRESGDGSNGSAAHERKFGEAVGVVLGPTDWGGGHLGPEVDVRWLPYGIRFSYPPSTSRRSGPAPGRMLADVGARGSCALAPPTSPGCASPVATGGRSALRPRTRSRSGSGRSSRTTFRRWRGSTLSGCPPTARAHGDPRRAIESLRRSPSIALGLVSDHSPLDLDRLPLRYNLTDWPSLHDRAIGERPGDGRLGVADPRLRHPKALL